MSAAIHTTTIGSENYRRLLDSRDELCEQLRKRSSDIPDWRAQLLNLEMALSIAAPNDIASMYWAGLAEHRQLFVSDHGKVNSALVRSMFEKVNEITSKQPAYRFPMEAGDWVRSAS